MQIYLQGSTTNKKPINIFLLCKLTTVASIHGPCKRDVEVINLQGMTTTTIWSRKIGHSHKLDVIDNSIPSIKGQCFLQLSCLMALSSYKSASDLPQNNLSPSLSWDHGKGNIRRILSETKFRQVYSVFFHLHKYNHANKI